MTHTFRRTVTTVFHLELSFPVSFCSFGDIDADKFIYPLPVERQGNRLSVVNTAVNHTVDHFARPSSSTSSRARPWIPRRQGRVLQNGRMIRFSYPVFRRLANAGAVETGGFKTIVAYVHNTAVSSAHYPATATGFSVSAITSISSESSRRIRRVSLWIPLHGAEPLLEPVR